jgi:hypothetical protein
MEFGQGVLALRVEGVVCSGSRVVEREGVDCSEVRGLRAGRG